MENTMQQGGDEPVVATRSRTRAFGLTVLGVLLIATACGAVFTAARFEQDFEAQLEQKDVLLGVNRADAVSSWLTGMVSQADRLIGADIFKVFASEVDQLGGEISVLLAPDTKKQDDDTGQMAAQLPLMRNLLSEFVSYSDFFAGRVLNRRGETYIATSPVTQPLTPDQQALIKKVLDTGQIIFCPVRTSPQGLMLDMLLPITAPRYEGKESRPVSVLMLTKAVSSKLGDVLASGGPLAEKGVDVYLVQKGYKSFQDVTPKGDALRDVKDFAPGTDGHLAFGVRESISGQGKVYSYGHKVPRIDWWIVQEREYNLTRAPLAVNTRIVYGLAALIGLVILLMGGAAWWWLVGRDQREVAERFCEMNSVIAEQKRLLDGINSTITDPISLTDAHGVFRYVNRAFGQVVGREPENTINLDSPAIFGFDTAKRLTASDQRVLMTGENVVVTETLWLQSRRYIFQISKSPLRNDEGSKVVGIVAVYRDITQTVEAEERGRRAVQQTIDALIGAIEASDPFLGGHSRIMGRLASLLAKKLQLSERDTQTIEAAANLSQIGKAFVPRELLLKPGKLTDEEKVLVESHVEHTREVLSRIEFDLPVLDAICQMNERLDGTGYPLKLEAEQISVHARVLAVANAFAAMARPRSYRAGMPVAKVLSILEGDAHGYDSMVVQALHAVLQTPEGEKLVQLAAASKTENAPTVC